MKYATWITVMAFFSVMFACLCCGYYCGWQDGHGVPGEKPWSKHGDAIMRQGAK